MSLAETFKDLGRSIFTLVQAMFSIAALIAQQRTARMPRTYRTEFPDFDTDLPTLSGFYDASWHNDACPKLVNADEKLTIWVDYQNPKLRESGSQQRYAIYNSDLDPPVVLYQSNDWESIEAMVRLMVDAQAAEDRREAKPPTAPMGSNRVVEIL